MASAVAGLALDAIEKATPVIIGALAPEIQKLLAIIPANTVKVVPPSIDIEVAVAANLLKAMPAFTAGVYSTIKSKIGVAVAIYVTAHPGDSLQSDVAWIDIQSFVGCRDRGRGTLSLAPSISCRRWSGLSPRRRPPTRR